MALEITQVSVLLLDPKKHGKLKAIARVILNDELQLTSLRVYDGSNGLFVSYPNSPDKDDDGEGKQCFYPVSKATRDHIQETILAKYKQQIEGVV
jgi:stage V sporulation protein G